LKERGFPSDTSFEPRDIVELYDAMVAVAKSLPAEYADRLTKLDPESFEEFQNLRRITRPQSRNYERLVKAEFHQWAKAGLDNAVDSAIDLLAQKYRDQSAKTEQELAAKSIRIDSIDFLTQHIVDLLCNLAHQDRLPAIVFCFDPDLCEQLLEAVVDRLEKEEFRQTQTTDEFKQRRALQKARDQQARQQKQQRDVRPFFWLL
jgi:superfamily II RNA helicase